MNTEKITPEQAKLLDAFGISLGQQINAIAREVSMSQAISVLAGIFVGALADSGLSDAAIHQEIGEVLRIIRMPDTERERLAETFVEAEPV